MSTPAPAKASGETAEHAAGYSCPHCLGTAVLVAGGRVAPAHDPKCPRHPDRRTAAIAARKAAAA